MLKAELEAWNTEVYLLEVGTKVELEGKRNPLELKGWRAEVHPEAPESMTMPG